MAQTPFERYGGFAKISRIVSELYDRMLESPVTAPYFDGVDMKRQIDHQTKFIAQLMGGPVSYTDDELARRHANLNIDDKAFDELATILKETLEDFDVDATDIAAVHGEFAKRRRLVVTR
jgi:hemoglobin